MFSRLAPAAPLAASLVWAAAFATDPGALDATGTVLAVTDLLLAATVGVVGMVLSGGRWARRLSLGVCGGGYLLAVLRPIDVLWWTGIVLTSLAALLLHLPVVTRHIRKLPSASGPPPKAVLVPIALIVVPFALAVGSMGDTRPLALLTSLTALLAAFWYVRVLPGGLIAVRLLWPLLALATAWPLGMPAGLVSVVAAITVAAFAWSKEAGLAFYPPVERGTTVPIPPELTPPDVLDAADLDDRGRPRR
ncbi:MAG: hypothetical protein ACE5F5_03925 [Acidimicrobiia bacterium]